MPCAKFTLCPLSLAFSYIGALRHGSRAVGVSQTLPRGTNKNGITKLSLLVIFNRGRHLYSKGGHYVGHRPTRVSGPGFVIAPTTLNGGQSNFARCLAVYWAGTLYILGGSYPLTEFCQVRNSLCVQVLRSPILAPLLHGTRAVGVSQTFRRSAEGRAAIMLGIGPNSSTYNVFTSLYNIYNTLQYFGM